MVEDARNVEIVEEVAVLSHTVGIMLCHEFKLLGKLGTIHHLDLSLELTDDVFEFVVNNDDSVAVLGVLDGLVGD